MNASEWIHCALGRCDSETHVRGRSPLGTRASTQGTSHTTRTRYSVPGPGIRDRYQYLTTHLRHHQLMGRACCGRGWRTRRTSGTGCHTCGQLVITRDPPWARWRWPPPWFQAATIWGDLAHETEDCAPNFG